MEIDATDKPIEQYVLENFKKKTFNINCDMICGCFIPKKR